ncbi:MAG: site-specific DNA-methyltransferase [Azospirillum sp.]|nr:site-specific DNA-methyltransferase [Azospirillum sp.]
MTKIQNPEHVATESPDQRLELLQRLKAAAPESFVEGRFDLDTLKSLLGEAAETGQERFTFNWAGKRDAIAMLQAPTRATLVPDTDTSINFDAAQHVFIEGENLEVLKVLYRSYFGRVKLIYIDPPYNKQEDFIYPDNFADPLDHYLRITGQKDGDGNYASTQTERSGRIHSAWLSMMFPRLSLARQLMREDAFIVVSIDDSECANLQRLMDDVFGEENRVAILVYDRNRKNDAKMFSVGHEYMVVYARNLAYLKEHETVLRAPKEGVEEVRAEFERLRKEYDDDWVKVREGILAFYKTYKEDDPRQPLARYRKVDALGPYRDDGNINWPGGGGPRYRISHPKTRKAVKLPISGWRYPTRRRFLEVCREGRIVFGPDETTVPAVRSNLFDSDSQVMHSVTFSYAQTASQQFADIFDKKKVFDNPKSYTDLERLVSYLSEPGDTVLDFFAGTNTTFHGVMRANRAGGEPRRMVAVQMAERIAPGSEASDNSLAMGMKTIADISRERARRVLANAEHKNDKAGLRCFKMAPSHIAPWKGLDEKTAEGLAKQLEVFQDTLVQGWKPEGVVWEAALREGYSLTAKLDPFKGSKGGNFWRVTDTEKSQSFTINLDDALTLEAVLALGLKKNDLFICRATALTDTLAANLALQCRLKVL